MPTTYYEVLRGSPGGILLAELLRARRQYRPIQPFSLTARLALVQG